MNDWLVYAVAAAGFALVVGAIVRFHPRFGAERLDAEPRRTKPIIRIRQDGWIMHDGGPFPFAPGTVVSTVDAHGVNGPHFAHEWPEEWWRWRSRQFGRDIRAYRIEMEAGDGQR